MGYFGVSFVIFFDKCVWVLCFGDAQFPKSTAATVRIPSALDAAGCNDANGIGVGSLHQRATTRAFDAPKGQMEGKAGHEAHPNVGAELEPLPKHTDPEVLQLPFQPDFKIRFHSK